MSIASRMFQEPRKTSCKTLMNDLHMLAKANYMIKKRGEKLELYSSERLEKKNVTVIYYYYLIEIIILLLNISNTEHWLSRWVIYYLLYLFIFSLN